MAAHAYGEVGPDGVVQSFVASKQAHGVALPALSIAAASLLRPDVAVIPGSLFRPAFRPGPLDIPSWSAADLLDGEVPLDAIVAVISALLREAVESTCARRESARLLQSLLHHLGTAVKDPLHLTAARRLEALRRLQVKVLAADATRRALLEGMEEGVVFWSADGEVLEANPAARRLWGGDARLEEIADAVDEELEIPSNRQHISYE